jgi:hypothetical protein
VHKLWSLLLLLLHPLAFAAPVICTECAAFCASTPFATGKLSATMLVRDACPALIWRVPGCTSVWAGAAVLAIALQSAYFAIATRLASSHLGHVRSQLLGTGCGCI